MEGLRAVWLKGKGFLQCVLTIPSLSQGPTERPCCWRKAVFRARQVALSALFLSSSIASRREGPEASSLPPAASLSLPWSHFPTKQLAVLLQHSLKKPVAQLQSSEQCFPPPSAVPCGRGGWCGGRRGADAAERKETVPSFLPSVCKFFIFIRAARKPETFPLQSRRESLSGADAAGLPAVPFRGGRRTGALKGGAGEGVGAQGPRTVRAEGPLQLRGPALASAVSSLPPGALAAPPPGANPSAGGAASASAETGASGLRAEPRPASWLCPAAAPAPPSSPFSAPSAPASGGTDRPATGSPLQPHEGEGDRSKPRGAGSGGRRAPRPGRRLLGGEGLLAWLLKRQPGAPSVACLTGSRRAGSGRSLGPSAWTQHITHAPW